MLLIEDDLHGYSHCSFVSTVVKQSPDVEKQLSTT